jgi:hypothetical protein
MIESFAVLGHLMVHTLADDFTVSTFHFFLRTVAYYSIGSHIWSFEILVPNSHYHQI